jgi:competence protein ComGC
MPACGKSNSGASSGTPSAAGTAGAPSADQVAATIADLTQAVRKFAVEQRQVPQTLDELVAKGYVNRIPAAPQGKKFVIDKNLQVHLANR